MNELTVKAIVAGIFFGMWPLVMNRSHLNGSFSTLVMSGVVFLATSPFAFSNSGNLQNANWYFAIGAGALAAIGIMSFNGMLAGAPVKDVGTLIAVSIIAQMALVAVYHAIVNHGISPMKISGLVLAAIAAVMINKG